MTYDPSLLQSHTTPHLSSVTNANGIAYPVTSSGTVDLTHLSLEHTLLVHTLANNLLYVLQMIEQLNCLVLIYPFFLSCSGYQHPRDYWLWY